MQFCVSDIQFIRGALYSMIKIIYNINFTYLLYYVSMDIDYLLEFVKVYV